MVSVDDLFSNAAAAVNPATGSVATTGAPNFISQIEQFGAQQLQGIVNAPPVTAQPTPSQVTSNNSTGGLGVTLQNVITSINQGTFFKTYQQQCLTAIVVIVLVKVIL